MVSMHMDAPPRVPGCLNGHAPKTYPAGRVCVACPTVLRRTNPGPWCDPCINNDAKARAVKEEKVDHVSDAEVLAELVTGEYVSGAAIGQRLDISRNAVNKHVKNLRVTGWHIAAASRKGLMLTDAKTAPAIPPAPAPVIPPPEQPANVAPAPELLRPQVGLAPFAGIDAELVVIGEVVRRIESLTGHETRVRVAAYVASRFLP